MARPPSFIVSRQHQRYGQQVYGFEALQYLIAQFRYTSVQVFLVFFRVLSFVQSIDDQTSFFEQIIDLCMPIMIIPQQIVYDLGFTIKYDHDLDELRIIHSYFALR